MSRLRIRTGTLAAGCDMPPPKPDSERSSSRFCPAPRSSQSNSDMIKAEVSKICRLAKCRPGHWRGPPPYGIHEPSRSLVEKMGPLLESGALFRNLPGQKVSTGCSFSEPVSHARGSRCATVVLVTMTLRFGMIQSRMFMSRRSGMRIT